MASGPKNIKTAVRVRPTLGAEPTDDGIIIDNSNNTIAVVNPRDPSQHFKFTFQSCYDASSTQEEIYNKDVECLLDNVYNGLVSLMVTQIYDGRVCSLPF